MSLSAGGELDSILEIKVEEDKYEAFLRGL